MTTQELIDTLLKAAESQNTAVATLMWMAAQRLEELK